MPGNHLYLIDGSSYIFRAYHRLPPLTNRHGVPAGAVYGFTTMLWKLIADLSGPAGPSHLAVIFDASSKTFRNDMYDQYKAHRPPPPEDLVPQFPLIRDATRAFSVPCIETEGLEADDIIACYSKHALAAGWAVTIVSSDKDLMQLIEPGLDMLDTMNDRRIGPEYVLEKFGVLPDRLGDVLALMGDSVDNVPGVPGIGPKTASQLIQQFGDLEGVLANAETIAKPKLRQSLIDHAEMARLSKRLVTLECTAPLPEPLDGLALQGIPPDPLRAFLEEMGFRSLLTKLQVSAPVTAPVAPLPDDPPFVHEDYELVIEVDALDRWIAAATAQGFVAIDTETSHLDAMRAELVGVSLATAPGRACYIPVGHKGEGDGMFAEIPVQLPRATVLEKLRPMLADPAVLKIGQNMKYDMLVLARAGVGIVGFDDTMILSYDLDAGLRNHGMDDLCKTHLAHSTIAFKDVCGSGKNQVSFDRVALDRATHYAAEDADVTLRLWRRLKPRLAAEGATRVYEMVDRPLVPVVAAMEREGILVDRAELQRLSADYAVEIARLEGLIHAAADGPFTIGSPKQLGEVLFERLGLKGGRKGKSGVYSTDVNELDRLAADGVEVARLVLEWRQLTKLKSTYTDALQEQINAETGRVHTSFSLAVAQTGRLSSTDPNLQNIPIRTELGRRIRDAFVAAPGNVILSADYSQIELRSRPRTWPTCPSCATPSRPAPTSTASPRRSCSARVDRETRGRAKTINFAILYGISAYGLSGRLGVDRAEAQAIIDRYFARFPGVSRYIADTVSTGARARPCRHPVRPQVLAARHPRQDPQRAPGGRAPGDQRPHPGHVGRSHQARHGADGPGAARRRACNDVRMLLQVHDELVFELPAGAGGARLRGDPRRRWRGAARPRRRRCRSRSASRSARAPSWGAAH